MLPHIHINAANNQSQNYIHIEFKFYVGLQQKEFNLSNQLINLIE